MELNKAVILFVGVVVAVCSGLPAQNLKDEVEHVKPVGTYGDQPIIDTGFFSGWDNPFSSNPFGGLFDSLESVMEKMRSQIAAILNRFPMRPSNSSDSPVFPEFINGVDLPAFPGIGDIDLSKGNSTSVRKVIDGHTVVINETEYKNEDENGGTFFKVRIIDFKPDSSELTTEKEAEVVPAEKDREEIENSFENEISKSNELRNPSNTVSPADIPTYGYNGIYEIPFSNIETLSDEVDSMAPTLTENLEDTPVQSVKPHVSTKKSSEWSEEADATLGSSEWHEVSPVKPLDSNEIEPAKEFMDRAQQPPPDLSSDIRVNDILAKNGTPINPDAEVFFVAEEPAKLSRILPDIDPR